LRTGRETGRSLGRSWARFPGGNARSNRFRTADGDSRAIYTTLALEGMAGALASLRRPPPIGFVSDGPNLARYTEIATVVQITAAPAADVWPIEIDGL
jgi:hypothetical protein